MLKSDVYHFLRFFSNFSQKLFEKTYKKNIKVFYNIYKIYVDNVCDILNEVGININTIPVLDIRRKVTHKAISDRTFSENKKIVSNLGKLCINLYKKNKIFTVIKHMPGHGLSKYDSHFKTPVIKNNKKQLIKEDFVPFRKCKSIFGMTAHVIYNDYDSKYTATHSKKIIKEIIRKHIKFRGILISDDISMKALKFSLDKNIEKALNAGCNLILHCNGNINEMKEISKIIPKIDKFTQKKTSDFYKFLR